LRKRAFTRPRPRLIVFLAAVSILPGLRVDNADAGNPVALAQLAVACLDGGRERGDAPPRGYARWCEKSDPFGVRRHGPYATWHPSGAKKEEGEYRDGWQHGRWTVWTTQGPKESEGEYRNGLKHGRWTTWEQGERTEGEYQHGLREGVWTTWSSSGVTLEEGPYVYGRKQGLWTQWYPDGSKQEQAEFVADQRHGRFIRYRAGIKASEATYRHNFPNGHVTMWHRNGHKSPARPTSATHAPPAPSRRGIPPV
jgi:antitoxin component YwqK of YwqJK toxin-antitoxin module